MKLSRIRRGWTLPLTLAGLFAVGILAPMPAGAGVIAVGSRGALGGDAFIDWATAGTAFDILPDPFTITSSEIGLLATLSNPDPTGAFERRDQSTGGWAGNFDIGDALLWTGFNVSGSSPGPMEIAFTSPVSGAGAQIQSDFHGAYVAFLDAFDGSTLLGHFELPGIASPDEDDSAIFLGVLSDTANIDKIVYSVMFGPSQTDGDDDFAINRLDLVTAPPPAGIPEPASLLLLGVGLTALGLRAYRRPTER